MLESSREGSKARQGHAGPKKPSWELCTRSAFVSRARCQGIPGTVVCFFSFFQFHKHNTNHWKHHSILRHNQRQERKKLKLDCTKRVLQNSLAQLSLTGTCQQKGLESTSAMAKLLIFSTAQISADMQNWKTSQQSSFLSFQVWQPEKPVFSF